MPSISKIILFIYLVAWVYLVAVHFNQIPAHVQVEIFWNAIVITFFIGLALNINAFRIRSRHGSHRSLRARIGYLRENASNVFGFFAIPFCVSSASGVAAAGANGNIVSVLFGTSSYMLVIAGGFVAFVALPVFIIYVKHGWDER